MATPPTFPDASDLAEGTGTRAFPAAVTTAAGDYLVVELVAEANDLADSWTPSCAALTFNTWVDTRVSSSDTGHMKWVALDTDGGGRTVTITPTYVAGRWKARVTVVAGSNGPSTGTGFSNTAQSMSVTRQADNSAMFMTVGDWSGGAVGTPVWTPGGATVASQAGAGGTYLFGRWDDAGSAGTDTTGLSTPARTTPSVAVLEMSGTTPAGPLEPIETMSFGQVQVG